MRSLTILLTLLPAAGLAQAPLTPAPTPAPSFEVATIKPAAPDARGRFISPGPGGGIRITNMTLKDIVEFAWSVQPFQLSGGPAWLDSVHYDIVAKLLRNHSHERHDERLGAVRAAGYPALVPRFFALDLSQPAAVLTVPDRRELRRRFLIREL